MSDWKPKPNWLKQERNVIAHAAGMSASGIVSSRCSVSVSVPLPFPLPSFLCPVWLRWRSGSTPLSRIGVLYYKKGKQKLMAKGEMLERGESPVWGGCGWVFGSKPRVPQLRFLKDIWGLLSWLILGWIHFTQVTSYPQTSALHPAKGSRTLPAWSLGGGEQGFMVDAVLTVKCSWLTEHFPWAL